MSEAPLGGASACSNRCLEGVSAQLPFQLEAQWPISRPDGSNLVAPTLIGTMGGTITAQLTVGGAYAVVIDPQGANTGAITLTLT